MTPLYCITSPMELGKPIGVLSALCELGPTGRYIKAQVSSSGATEDARQSNVRAMPSGPVVRVCTLSRTPLSSIVEGEEFY